VRDTANSQRRGGTTGPASLGDGGIESGEDLPRLRSERATGVGRAHHAARPLEELDAELRLDLSDRLGQRRLRYAQAFGRPAEVQLLVDREEVAQVPQLNRGGRQAMSFSP
jgi:hypothetical protein